MKAVRTGVEVVLVGKVWYTISKFVSLGDGTVIDVTNSHVPEGALLITGERIDKLCTVVRFKGMNHR